MAVCDIEKDRADLIAEKYNINSYSCMHEMMSKNEIDVIVILTESGLHAKHTIELAKYGSHIMVENLWH